MSAEPAVVISVVDEKKDQLAKVTRMAHEAPIDFANALTWADGVERVKRPKIAEHSWFYGLPSYAMLTEEQRLEVLWHGLTDGAIHFRSAHCKSTHCSPSLSISKTPC